MQAPEPQVNGSHAPQAADGAQDEVATSTARLRAELEGAFAALLRAAYVQRQALSLKLFDSALRMGAVLVVGISVLALAVTSAMFAMLAVRRGLSAALHGAWWSDLVLAAAVAVLLAVAATLARRAFHKSVLQRTRRRLAEGKSPAATARTP